MKRLFLPLVCVALMAAPSFAQDETSTYSSTGNTPAQEDLHRRRNIGGGADDRPVAPVPEPGTMALAAMGLIALGAATRKFRGQ